MSDQQKLTDVLARVVAGEPLSLETLRDRAAEEDQRAGLLPVHALEQLLKEDDRFMDDGGRWTLTPEAPVAGVSLGQTTGLLDTAPHENEPITEFVILDVEATDTQPTRANLIEIAAVRVKDWSVLDTFETFVYADDVPHAVTALTGISPSDLRSAPLAENAVASLASFVGDLPILGQNVGYDLEVIRNVDPDFKSDSILETLDLAHIAFPNISGRTLEELADRLDVEMDESHRALADCHTTLSVAQSLVEQLNTDDALHRMIRSLLQNSHHPWARILDPASPPTLDADLVGTSGAPWLTRDIGDSPRAPTATAVFGEGGELQFTSDDVDFRPAQLEMAEEVEDSLGAGKRLLVEAPTGTGKTYAYLVPGIRAAERTQNPVWISTNTKALQTQLQSDFQRLKSLNLISGDLAVLKGKDNYICTRDLLAATEVDLHPEAAVEVATILSLLWSAEEGELGEATDYWLTARHPGASQIKSTVKLNPATCEQRNCDFITVCPYFTALDNAKRASAVAVNHALLVKALGGDELDQVELAGLIIDEAHSLEDAATSSLTENIDPAAITSWLNQLIDPQSSSGLLRNVGRGFRFSAREDVPFAAALETVRRNRKAIRDFAERMATYLSEFVGRPEFGEYPITHRFRLGVDDRRYLFLEARQALFSFADLTKQLVEALHRLLSESDGRTVDTGFNAKALRRRLRAEAARGNELIELALTSLTLTDDQFVAYATWEAFESEIPKLTVTRAPIDVSDVLRRVYDKAPAVVGTSATLQVGGTFDFMKERLAAQDFTALQVQETFDYSQQASLLLTRHLPVPSTANEAEFVEAVADTAVAAIGTARGGTLALFTSRQRLVAAFEHSEAPIRYEGLDLRGQLPGVSVRELATWFRDTNEGSLFGLRSFWQGFDAPGDTLRLLLIEKLPFPSPGEPLFAARSERMEAEGRDPFYEYAVPGTALSLKQGFGRLIRTKDDRGVVAVLDRRVRTGLAYQAEMLDSLPSDVPIMFPNDETEFLDTLAGALGVLPRHDLATGVGPQRAVFDLEKTTINNVDDPEEIRRALDEILKQFHLSDFRPGQEELIRAVVTDGRDIVGLLPTGAGKSLIFQAASMALDGLGIVVSPLVALMKDQVDGLRNELGFRWAYALFGGQTGAERDEIIDAIRTEGCRLLYVSPERLRDPSLLRTLASSKITFVAVDEAHCVSAWGHDFRPDFLSIVPALSQLPNAKDAPRMALTATAPDEVFEDITRQLQLRDPVVERISVDRPNIHFTAIKCRNKKEKRSQLLRVALAHEDQPGIVYCTTRNDAESTAALLKSHGVSARHYHAGMPAEQRQAVQEMFMSDQVQVICATNAFGLGVDKPDIGFVAHWSLPMSLDSYFQEAGRAARDPRLKGTAVLIWAPSDLAVLRRMATSSLPSREELEKLEAEISRLHQPFATIDDLSAKTGLDEISTRVGIHILERAGAIAQGSDVAARAFIAVPSSLTRIRERFGDDLASEVEGIVSASDLTAPGRAVVDIVALATDLSIPPIDLEQRMLAMTETEVLAYRPLERAMLLEPRNPDWNKTRIEEDLRLLRQSASNRLDAMKTYADTRQCRRGQIFQHFDQKPVENCGYCDICAGEPEALGSVDPGRYLEVDVVTQQVTEAITGIVKEASRLGSTPGRRSFVRGLKGTKRWAGYQIPEVLQRSRWLGALRYLTETEIEEAIDILISRRQIAAVERTLSNGEAYTGLDIRL